MKYVLVIGDGMADNPLAALGGKTPLEAANKPTIDQLAAAGETGTVRTVPQGVAPGSDTAILNILGFDPRCYYTGRSPLEAAGAGVLVRPGEVSYRCNMVALEDADKPFEEKRILSHSGGSVEGETAIRLMEDLLADPAFAALAKAGGMVFHPSASFRHIAVQTGVSIEGLRATPPHDHLGEVIGPLLPTGAPAAEGLRAMMRAAHTVLDKHPLNEQRRAQGKLPANGIWFWAEGAAAQLPSFADKYGKRGFAVSAVPLVRGIGALAGLDTVEVDGATGELDTNFEGKTEAVRRGLVEDGYDFAVLHIEAPDECTHNGDLPGKIQAIEWLDSRCVAPLAKGLAAAGQDYRMLILSDHKTLTDTRGHDGEPVPYILYDSRRTTRGSGAGYTEAACAGGVGIEQGDTLMERLFSGGVGDE